MSVLTTLGDLYVTEFFFAYLAKNEMEDDQEWLTVDLERGERACVKVLNQQLPVGAKGNHKHCSQHSQ